MIKLFFAIIMTFVISEFTYAQTYTTTSKSCGNCGSSVSINAKIGEKCPHCGVIWGSKNTQTSYSTNKTPSYTYTPSSSYTPSSYGNDDRYYYKPESELDRLLRETDDHILYIKKKYPNLFEKEPLSFPIYSIPVRQPSYEELKNYLYNDLKPAGW